MIISYLLVAMLSTAETQTTAGSIASSADASVGAAAPPKAIANLASYFGDADYPVEAIRNEEQGTVRFRLHITPQGLVGRCEIVESSGSASLDETTCRIMVERARFTPARDSNGAAVADQVESRIRWVLPEEGKPIALHAAPLAELQGLILSRDYPSGALAQHAEGSTELVLLVAPDGSVSDCSVLRSAGSPDLDEASCRILKTRARFSPARAADGDPQWDNARATIRWTLPRRRAR